MNIQNTVHNFILSSPMSSMNDIVEGTGFDIFQIRRAVRTLLAHRLAERGMSSDGKTRVYKGIRAERRKDIKGSILKLVKERGSVTPAEVSKITGIPSDYARHALRNLLDQHMLARQPVAGTKTWRYVPCNSASTFGRSPRLIELYSLVLPVQQGKAA